MADLDYQRFYELQDRVLEVVFAVEKEFYLTGGTCLGRFYQAKRYSDDLDFFANASPRYAFAIRRIKQALEKKFDLVIEVEGKDFNRFRIDHLLRVDFVNDLAEHHKDIIVTDKGYLIDNVENILSNKLTAIIGRDNPKDIFDIYLIARFYSFSWQEMLVSAHKKAVFTDEELIVRLKSFPPCLLSSIKLIDADFLQDFDAEFSRIVQAIAQAALEQQGKEDAPENF